MNAIKCLIGMYARLGHAFGQNFSSLQPTDQLWSGVPNVTKYHHWQKKYWQKPTFLTIQPCQECNTLNYGCKSSKSPKRRKICKRKKKKKSKRNPWDHKKSCTPRKGTTKLSKLYFEDQVKCHTVCPPPLDVKYYCMSDKRLRKYQRTWPVCIVVRKPLRLKCVIKHPQFRNRRQPKRKRKTACPMDGGQKLRAICKMDKDKRESGKCEKIVLPFCGEVGRKTRCPVYVIKKKCTKRLTPYPAYSECCHEDPPQLPPVECECNKVPPICKIWRYYRNQIRLGQFSKTCKS